MHFNNKSSAEFTRSRLDNYLIIDGNLESMTDFFKEFLAYYGERILKSCRIVREYDE